MGGFLPFLPTDNDGIRGADSELTIRLINDDLGTLLSLDSTGFWDIVLHDDSLHVCIDTYLRFKRRTYDDKRHNDVQGSSAIEQELARRVFMVLLRMVATSEGGRGVPSREEKAQWLFEQHCLSVPNLMDIAALYASSNPEPTKLLIQSVFSLQPLFLDEVQTLVEPLVANLEVLQSRASAIAKQAVQGNAVGQQLLDITAYVRDMCHALGSFVGCYPQAAALLMEPGQGQLLAALAGVHDRLLPTLAAAFQQAPVLQGCDKTSQQATTEVTDVAATLQLLVYQLISLAYLVSPSQLSDASKSKPLPGLGTYTSTASTAAGSSSSGYTAAGSSSGAQGSSSYATGSGSGSSHMSSSAALYGGSSSSYGAGGSSSKAGASSSSSYYTNGHASYSAGASSSRAYGGPSNGASGSSSSALATAAVTTGGDSEQRGTGLMNAVMCASQVEGSSGPTAGPGADTHLMHAVNSRFGLDVAVAKAMKQGDVLLDDAQMDYLLAILGSGSRDMVEAAAQRVTPTGNVANPVPPSTSAAETAQSEECDPAVLASLISQIKDLMGDTYGDGYLTACLHAYGYNAEQVLNHLLEGSVTPELKSLDPKLASWKPPSKPAPPVPQQPAGGMTWQGLRVDAAAHQQTQAAASAARAAQASATSGQQLQKKTQIHKGVARVLGRVDDDTKATTRALALELEYEDEYDDSFDDLVNTGPDGVADIEGDYDNDKAGKVPIPATYDDEPDDSQTHRTSYTRDSPRDRGRGGRAGANAPGRGKGPVTSRPGLESESNRQAATPGIASAQAEQQSRLQLPPGQRQAQQAQSSQPAASTGRTQRAPLMVGAGTNADSAGKQQQRDSDNRTSSNASGRGRGRGRGGPTGKLWVLDGRIYNYAKEGAQEVSGQQEADQAVQAAKEAAQAIYGLGAGGNRGAANSRWEAIQGAAQQARGNAKPTQGSTSEQPATEEAGAGQADEGAASQDMRQGRGRGRGGPPNYARKEQNKAAVANHHRKDRAFKKMGMM